MKIGAGCSIRRAIIDRHVEIAPGTVIGENPELDAKRFHISPEGIVVVAKGQKLGSRMEHINIWFAVAEVQGLVKSGGLADVAKALPKALQKLGHDVSIVIPGYSILPGFYEAEEVLSTELDFWPHTPYNIRKMYLDGVSVYALSVKNILDRSELYAENNIAYTDNGERFSFFSAAVLDCLPKLDIQPDIIHTNDWHTDWFRFC